ncbi:hypothetical protein EMIT0357P_40385 [Pseudomonas marginalis]
MKVANGHICSRHFDRRCKVIFGRASLMSIFRVRGQNVSQNIELAPRFKAVCTVLNPLFFSIFY